MRPLLPLAGIGALALLGAGCQYALQQEIDKEIGTLSKQADDPGPPRSLVDPPPPVPTRTAAAAAENVPAPDGVAVRQAAYFQEKPPAVRPRTLEIPNDLPGADAPPIVVPKDPVERRRFFEKFYPPIPPLAPEPPRAPGPEGRPLSLADLQRLAETYSPAVKSAEAAAEAARGNASQAGAYPNPTLGWEHDTIQTGPAGYPGFWVDQVIKTGGKLTVAQAAATMDLVNAKLALRRARSDARYAVRGYYFALLTARESIRVNEALFRFTEEVYRVQVDLLATGGLAAGYEPMQLRPLAESARLNVLVARNQAWDAWRQLVATIGLRDMPPTEVEGGADLPVPEFDHDAIRAGLGNHTDVLTASVTLQKAKYQLQQAKLQVLPDLELRVLTQKDYTTPPNQVANSVTLSLPVPIWDQNRGGIYAAKWGLAQASVGPEQARNALSVGLADAFTRYLNARQTVDVARRQIRDQVRVYRGLYERRNKSGDVGFGDLVTAQQTLAGFVTSYVAALGLQWQATVDVANFLQTEDLFAGGRAPRPGPEPLPDLRCLIPPPDHEHTATAAERVGLIPSPLRKPPRPGAPPAPGHGPADDAAAAAPPPAPPAAPAAPPPALPPAAEAAPALPMLPKRAALPEPQGQGAGPLVPLDPGPSTPAGRPRTTLSEELRRGSLPPPTSETGQ